MMHVCADYHWHDTQRNTQRCNTSKVHGFQPRMINCTCCLLPSLAHYGELVCVHAGGMRMYNCVRMRWNSDSLRRGPVHFDAIRQHATYNRTSSMVYSSWVISTIIIVLETNIPTDKGKCLKCSTRGFILCEVVLRETAV